MKDRFNREICVGQILMWAPSPRGTIVHLSKVVEIIPNGNYATLKLITAKGSKYTARSSVRTDYRRSARFTIMDESTHHLIAKLFDETPDV